MFATLLKKPNIIVIDTNEGVSPGQRALPVLASPEHSQSSPAARGASTSPQSPLRSPGFGRVIRRLSSGDNADEIRKSINFFPSISSKDVRLTTPLTLSVSQPISYESPVAKRVLSERAMRARTRDLQARTNGRLVDDTFGLWLAVMKQKHLAGERFAKLREILGGIRDHDLKYWWEEWKETSVTRKLIKRKINRFLDWVQIRGIATAFVKWQVLWAGCCDCRPIKKEALRRLDYDRARMSIDQVRRWLATERGRSWLAGASEAENDEQFYNLCRSSMIDVETLADVSIEELVSEDGPNLPLPKAQAMYIQIKKLVTSNYSRLKQVLFANSRTRLALASYLHMVDLIRQQVGQGIHPLGKTRKELFLEGRKEHDSDGEEEEEFGELKVDWRHLAVDMRVNLEGRVLQKYLAPAQNDFQAPDWCRGYVVDFPDRIVGTLYVKSIFVDLILWDESVAYCFVIGTNGKVLKRSKYVKGETHLPRRYEFEIGVEIPSGVAIMCHLAARLQASKYMSIKDHLVERRLNPLLSIRPVQCSKKFQLTTSQVQLQMWMVVDRRRGQEEMEPEGEAAVAEDYAPDQVFSDSEHEDDDDDDDDDDSEDEGEKVQDPHPNKKKVTFPGREGVVELDRSRKFRMKKGVESEEEETVSPLAKVTQYSGERLKERDLVTQHAAQFASAFNPKYSEFWIMEPFPSTYANCMDYNGAFQRRIDMGCHPNCMHIDAKGRVYGCDFKQTFYKLMHERAYEPTMRMEVDRIYRLWYLTDTWGAEERARRMSTANGIAVHPKKPGVCYVAYSRGPILILDSQKGERIGHIDPDPPFLGVSALVVASDVLVVGDSHQVKIFTTGGSCVSVLGDCYNEPCLMWTGLELFAADKGSCVWQCFGAQQAPETERSQQKHRALRCRKYWSEKMPLRLCTPNTKVRVKSVRAEYSAAMDLDGRPLSRALGQSKVLAFHQGLMYYDEHDGRYIPGQFWTQNDEEIRDMISELKEEYPDLPVDAGSLLRPS